MTIKAGCYESVCSPWEPPKACPDFCEGPEAENLFECWWEAVTQWLFEATCRQFPGCCPAETEPCPPCECRCLNYCGCGPWGTIPLDEAFCYDVCLNSDGQPMIELAFPQEDGSIETIQPGDGVFELRPDLVSLDFCEPIVTDQCSGSWPAQDHCGRPWTIRAMTGAEPPKMLLLGAERFVNEIVKECQGKDSCLPQGVKSITRRGITMEVGDQFSETVRFDSETTGIPRLDLALKMWGDCEGGATILDPLRATHERQRKVWTFRGRLTPTQPSWV